MAYISFQPKDYFNTVLYTGANKSVTGVGFRPDWSWFKQKTNSSSALFDAVRGATKFVESNSTNAEVTDATTLTSFDSDGFTLGADSSGYVGGSSSDTVSWHWKANGAGSSNTDGDITATVSANTTSGFSIIKFTSAGSVSQTYGHGLNGTPKLWIIKDTSQSSNNWQVYYNGTDRLKLDTTEATSTTAAYLMSANATTITTPSNSDSAWGNGNGVNYITYAFQEIQGFSKIGKYTGNGNADGSFIYTGFKPAYVLTKRSDTAESWVIQDNKQSPYNPTHDFLLADTTGVPTAGGTPIDILSNGFKVRTTSVYSNASGGTYIYLAFAEAPLVSSNGIPAVAR
jgi:hypothetical protein